MKKTIAILLGLTATAALAATTAPEPTLKIGSPAPKLQNGKYIQGEPVKEFKSGTAYIVEFWATWCGPCRASIPHLNDIYNKYKDKGLVVIGQDCWERDEAQVAPFVKKMGDKMTYRVALDDKDGNDKGKMAEAWMAAAGRNGIPSAFLVDKHGMIAWIGHPMSLKETDIEDVLADKFDIKKAAAAAELEQKNQAALRIVFTKMTVAMQKKNWDEAAKQIAEAEKLLPADQRDQLDMPRFDLSISKKDYPTAYKLAQKMSDAHKDNVGLQNELAWRIATDDAIEERDLNLAQKLATRANDISKGQDPAVLDTLARIAFMQGRKAEAINYQQKAVDIAEGNDKQDLAKALASYKKGELPKLD